jgi:phospholipase D1/2
VWDVFLLDPDFRIERPKRYYRQVGHLLHHDKKELDKQDQETSQAKEWDNDGTHSTGRPNDQREYRHFAPEIQLSPPENDHKSIISSIRTHISKVFHHDLSASSQSREERGDRNRDGNALEAENDSNPSSPSISLRSGLHSRAPTPLLDPSTNTNPLQDDTEIEGKGKNKLGTTDTGVKQEMDPRNDENKTISLATAAKNKFSTDVSKHTFYILNSQMRLKLFAKNEVSHSFSLNMFVVAN